MAIYNNIYIVLNGSLLAESVSVETTLERASDPVFSIVDQFVGISPGPLMRRISVKNVIPLTGSELPFEDMMVRHTPVEILLQEGTSGRACISRGVITDVSRSGGVGQSSVLSFGFMGSGVAFFR